METPTLVDRRTRQRILAAAVNLLSQRGLYDGLLEDAAKLATVTPQRARIFFQRDEDLVLALYGRLAVELESRISELPDGDLAERFRQTMYAKVAIVSPYRAALAALLATLLDPRHELGALSRQTEIIRNRVMGIFAAVVAGSHAHHQADAPRLTGRLYGLHLALMLLWTQDQSPDAAATRAGIDLVADLLSLSGKLSFLPGLKNSVARMDEVVAPIVEPQPDPTLTELSIKILRCLFQHRRLSPMAGTCFAEPCQQCLALHLPRVRRFVSAAEPIHFLLPAFPAKSPNSRKVLGRLPDMAEELALGFLQRVCDEIGALYKPGARITICSDGRVFSDLVGVSDDDVSDYGREISTLLNSLKSKSLDLFQMEDLFELATHSAMRDQLLLNYADSVEAIKERTRKHEHHQALFNGIQRFLFEDRVAMETDLSRTKIRNECGERTYQVIQRSDAWGRLLNDCFPAALRLSIHPQNPHSEKIGILLGVANDAWLTPWHGVAVNTNGKFQLMRRHEAEALGARLISRAGRPSHYQIDENV